MELAGVVFDDAASQAEPEQPKQAAEQPDSSSHDAQVNSALDGLYGPRGVTAEPPLATMMAAGKSEGDVMKVALELKKLMFSVQENPAPVQQNDKADPAWVSALRDAVETGAFDLRASAVGQKWSKEVCKDKKLASDYKGCISMQDKKNFRAEWARRKLAEVEVSKTHLKSYQVVNEKHGEYLSFGAIAVQYGFAATPHAAMESARKYCEKCINIGGKWIMYEEMGELLLFFFLQFRYHQTMAESWAMHEKESAQTSGSNKDPAKLEDNKQTAKPKPKAKAEHKPQAANPSPDAKAPLPRLMTTAYKLKARYHKAENEAKMLKDLIGSDKTWQWANCDMYQGELVSALSELCKHTDAFARTVLLAESKELKNKYGTEHLVVNLERFLTLSDHVDRLEKINAHLNKMKLTSELKKAV